MGKVVNVLMKIGALSVGLQMMKMGIADMSLSILIIAGLLIWFSTRKGVKKVQRMYRKNKRTYRKVKRNLTSAGKIVNGISRFI